MSSFQLPTARRHAMALLASLALSAVMPHAARADTDCANANTQSDMNICATADAAQADSALNLVYGKVMKRVTDPQAKKLLRDAERAWISYRTAECDFVGFSTTGGSIQPMIIAGCLADIARQRTKALEAYLTCEEGDLSCPTTP